MNQCSTYEGFTQNSVTMLSMDKRRYKQFVVANIYFNSCPTQGPVEGWDAMKALYWRSMFSKDAGRAHLTHHHKGGRNETKWMCWVRRNGRMKFVARENGRNPKKKLPRLRFNHHESHMDWPRSELGTPAVGGERLTAFVTEPPDANILGINDFLPSYGGKEQQY